MGEEEGECDTEEEFAKLGLDCCSMLDNDDDDNGDGVDVIIVRGPNICMLEQERGEEEEETEDGGSLGKCQSGC